MKRLKCGCRWDGWTMRRCARHREAGRFGADILGIPPPDGGNTMKTATRECVACGGPLVISGVIDTTLHMHASCRIQTITRHGSPDWNGSYTSYEKLREDCPECASSATMLGKRKKSADGEKLFYECRECGCEWYSTPQPSVEVKPIVIEGKEEPQC